MKLEDADCTTKELEKLVAYYPKPEYWKQLLYTLFQDTPGQSTRAMLQLYRLMSEVDVLKRPEDYTEMAQLAIEQGSPGEAQHVLEKGFQKNVFADPRRRTRTSACWIPPRRRPPTDQASLPKIEQDADAAKTGDKDVGVGLAYLGYQQYDKAADALKKGLPRAA